MKNSSWTDYAEIVGIGAIVASLMFVGLELRQSREIALGEGAVANAANVIEVSNALSAHAEVWVKGRSGGELNEVERVIFRNLVLNENSQRFFNWQRARQVGYDDASDAITLNMARFLIDNPGARQVWIDQETAKERTHKVAPNRDVNFGWFDAVKTSLGILEGVPK